MKIFATSDLHGNKTWMRLFKKYLKNECDADIVLVCGDIGGSFGRSFEDMQKNQRMDYAEFLEALYEIESISRFRAIRFILGNDDWFECGPEEPLYLSEKEVIKVDGEKIILVPFELVHIMPFSTNREANENKLHYELEKTAKMIREEDMKNVVFCSHGGPYGACDLFINGIDHFGSTSMRSFIERHQPKAWFCGHIHEAFGVDKIGQTTVLNCANYDKDVFRGHIFDTLTGKCEAVNYSG
ncbi:MAG: metallophosphoesterase [Clostridia bacterium]|nr:metallophosphoesterase [Clostridia bacterium]